MTDIPGLDAPFRCLIDGELVGEANAAAINPATEREVARYAVAGAALVDRAAAAALRAQAQWARSPLGERRALLARIAALIDDNSANLAQLLTLEQGKPASEARDEVDGAAWLIRHYAELHAAREDSLFDSVGESHSRFYTPLGPVVGIVPWNFPLLIAAMKIAPALLTGNAIILKPAPTTPLTTLRLGELCAGVMPAGLLQILGDDGGTGPLLTAHPDIRKIAFTGSTATGRRIAGAAAETLKRTTLELGGNDAAIVLADADPDAAAAALYPAAFTNAGQICGAAKRLYVHATLFDRFCAALASHVEAAVVGDGSAPGTTMGPVQNLAQYRRATELLADASARGSVIAAAPCPAGRGYFVPPTLFAGLADTHPLVAGEQFAPLLPVQSFTDESEAIDRANGTPFGLTASVWTRDIPRGQAIARALDAALIGVNSHNESPMDLGISMARQSGVGWLMGDEGLKEYLQPHLVV